MDGLVAAGMIEERRRGAECDLHLTRGRARRRSTKLTEARRNGLTELLEGWNPEEHPEIIEMVKDLAHSLLADDERLVADAMPEPAGAGAGAGGRVPGPGPAGSRGPPGRPEVLGVRARRPEGEVSARGRPARSPVRPMASSPISAAPSTGGASRRTSTARGATSWTPARHALVEGDVAGVEHAAAEHDLDRFVLQVEPDDGGPDERGDLVGQRVGRLAGERVAVGGRVEEHARQLEEAAVGDGAGVDAA